MRLSIPRSILAEHLQIVAKAVPNKSNLAMLEGILFTCEANSMTLSATNLELGISSTFPIEQQEIGKVVLPAKVVEIMRKLPGETVQLTVNPENYLTEIVSGHSEFQLYGFNPDEYPSLTQFSAQTVEISFNVKVTDFRRALRQTLFCVSNDERKPAFTGLLFSLQDERLTLSASDTFRLATTNCRVNKTVNSGKFLVPARNLQEVLRIFTEEEEIIQVLVTQNQILLSCRDKKITSRLLEETFPNVERVIPKEFTGCASLDCLKFMQAVERSSLLSEGTNNVVRLSIGEDCLVIRTTSKYGKNQEKISLELTGEAVEISLNSRFIIEMLKISEGEKCIIELTGANKPCILRDSLHDDYLYLILPIKI
ncbi:MAG: DNA polymerase III subunit beta [Dethiobacter sp.]|jgi:DNA polymerase-3 subunit beta|nr:DNA polymerase III subunit beta [Dethiobacter sp.]MBS3982889.1 DNA polymerase III subunit beta [Dethiobacter sp.]MCL4462999.1 DNA polymerase III subunit beta [Bacillota bacterium]MCL5994251.1 DNA polymerase III subunit beta [Bacillota bacterium]